MSKKKINALIITRFAITAILVLTCVVSVIMAMQALHGAAWLLEQESGQGLFRLLFLVPVMIFVLSMGALGERLSMRKIAWFMVIWSTLFLSVAVLLQGLAVPEELLYIGRNKYAGSNPTLMIASENLIRRSLVGCSVLVTVGVGAMVCHLRGWRLWPPARKAGGAGIERAAR